MQVVPAAVRFVPETMLELYKQYFRTARPHEGAVFVENCVPP